MAMSTLIWQAVFACAGGSLAQLNIKHRRSGHFAVLMASDANCHDAPAQGEPCAKEHTHRFHVGIYFPRVVGSLVFNCFGGAALAEMEYRADAGVSSGSCAGAGVVGACGGCDCGGYAAAAAPQLLLMVVKMVTFDHLSA